MILYLICSLRKYIFLGANVWPVLIIFTGEVKLSRVCTSSCTFATVCDYCINAIFTMFALFVYVL